MQYVKDKPYPQHHAEKGHRQGGVVGAEHPRQQADKHDGKGHDQRRTHRHGDPVAGFFLLCIAGGYFSFQNGGVQLQSIIKFHGHG